MAKSAVLALEEALTKDVADAVMTRAFEDGKARNRSSVSDPRGRGGVDRSVTRPGPMNSSFDCASQPSRLGSQGPRISRVFHKRKQAVRPGRVMDDGTSDGTQQGGTVRSVSPRGRPSEAVGGGALGEASFQRSSTHPALALSGAAFLNVDAWKGVVEERAVDIPYLKEFKSVSVVFTGDLQS